MVQAHGSETTENMLKNVSKLGLHRARQVFDGGPHRGHAVAMPAAPAPRVVDALPKSRRYHTLSRPELHSALASSRSSSLYLAPLRARACVCHGRWAELAVTAVP